MIGVNETPDGVVPKIISGGLFHGVPQQYTGDGEEFQEIQIGDAGLSRCNHSLIEFFCGCNIRNKMGYIQIFGSLIISLSRVIGISSPFQPGRTSVSPWWHDDFSRVERQCHPAETIRCLRLDSLVAQI